MTKRFLGRILVAVSAAALSGPLPAIAGCTTTGAIDVTECDNSGVQGWVQSGTASLAVTGLAVDTASADYGAISMRGPQDGFVYTTLTVDDTTVDTTGANGVMTRTENGNIDITTGSDVTINSSGKGLVGWVNLSGGIVITNYATINAGQDDAFTNHVSEAGTEGIDGSAHGEASSVSITNYGTITSTYGRGIYADGGNGSSTTVAVTIDNEAKIDAFLAGARAIDYHGTATVLNGADATIISRNHQAVVAWSDDGDAVVGNRGTIIADNGAGIVAWGSADVGVDNYGTVSAASIVGQPTTSVSYYGIEGFSQVAGDVVIDNHAGATVTATYSDGLYGHGVSGSVDIVNDGRVTAADAGIRADTVDGAISIRNTGWVGADGSGGGVVLTGTGLTGISLQNAQGGVIAASSALSAVPRSGDPTALAPSDQTAFAAAAVGRAVSITADTTTFSIANAGTIIGNIIVAPSQVGDATGTAGIDNSGVWAFSGSSGFDAGVAGDDVRNSGAIWTYGASRLTADLVNDGALRVGSLGGVPGRLVLDGAYAGGNGSTLAFDLASVGTQADPAVVEITGDVTGKTRVLLVDPARLAGLSWNELPRGEVIKVDGSAEAGRSSFAMNQSYGLITVGLGYSPADRSWSLGYSTASAGRTLSRLPRAGRDLLDSVLDAGEDRLSQLRDGLRQEVEIKPYAFAEAPANPISSALDIAEASRPRFAAWTRALGGAGNGDGYDRRSGQIASGIDGSFVLESGSHLFLGLSAGYGTSRLTFNGNESRATLSGPGVSGYAGLVLADGSFLDLNAGWQGLDTDIDLAGIATDSHGGSFGGKLTAGRRFDGWGLEVTPSVAVGASRTSFDGFAMQGLGVTFDDSDAFVAEAGIELAQPIATEIGELKVFGGLKAGDRAVSGKGVSISGTGTYGEDADGLFGRMNLGVSMMNKARNAMVSFSGSIGRDTHETSGELRLTGSLAF